jgi:hypothetical protein
MLLFQPRSAFAPTTLFFRINGMYPEQETGSGIVYSNYKPKFWGTSTADQKKLMTYFRFILK